MQTIRRFCTALVAGLIVCFLLSTEANALSGPGEPLGGDKTEWTYGVHMVSAHVSGKGLETITPGLYAIHSSGVTFGAFRNSYARPSVYLAYSLQRGPWALTMGGVTGYSRAKVLPMLAPSYKFDNGMRVSLIPSPFGHTAIHLSKEF